MICVSVRVVLYGYTYACSRRCPCKCAAPGTRCKCGPQRAPCSGTDLAGRTAPTATRAGRTRTARTSRPPPARAPPRTARTTRPCTLRSDNVATLTIHPAKRYYYDHTPSHFPTHLYTYVTISIKRFIFILFLVFSKRVTSHRLE